MDIALKASPNTADTIRRGNCYDGRLRQSLCVLLQQEADPRRNLPPVCC